MAQETALGAALKSAVQTMSKKKQTDMIADHIYGKYDVFKRFKPLAVGIDQDLVAALPQYDPALIARVLAASKAKSAQKNKPSPNSTQPFNRHWLHKPNAKPLRLLQKQKRLLYKLRPTKLPNNVQTA